MVCVCDLGQFWEDLGCFLVHLIFVNCYIMLYCHTLVHIFEFVTKNNDNSKMSKTFIYWEFHLIFLILQQ